MKKTLLLGLFISSFYSFSQITITSSDFPDGGDTVMVSVSVDFDVDYEDTGEDFSWDYSALNMNSQRIDTFFDISDASFTYQLIFNNGWLDPDYQADYYTHFLNFVIPSSDLIPVSLENPVNFTKVESDKVEIIGIGLEIEGLEVPIKNDIIDVEYELPMNYGDTWVSNSLFTIDLNPAYDGTLIRHLERTAEVDGWGEITTPFGTFDVIRTVAVLDYTDSLELTIGDISTWVELPTPTQRVYSWWAENQKIPVLQIITQEIFSIVSVTSVEYKDSEFSDVGIDDFQANGIEIYPNPAKDFIQINTDYTINQVDIYSIDGQLLQSNLWSNDIHQINVSNLTSGTYILKVTTKDNVLTKQIVIQ